MNNVHTWRHNVPGIPMNSQVILPEAIIVLELKWLTSCSRVASQWQANREMMMVPNSLNWTHKWWKLPLLKSPITLAHSSWLPRARREIQVGASGHNYWDWVNVCHLTLDPGSFLLGFPCPSPALSLDTEDHLESDSTWYLTPVSFSTDPVKSFSDPYSMRTRMHIL